MPMPYYFAAVYALPGVRRRLSKSVEPRQPHLNPRQSPKTAFAPRLRPKSVFRSNCRLGIHARKQRNKTATPDSKANAVHTSIGGRIRGMAAPTANNGQQRTMGTEAEAGRAGKAPPGGCASQPCGENARPSARHPGEGRPRRRLCGFACRRPRVAARAFCVTTPRR